MDIPLVIYGRIFLSIMMTAATIAAIAFVFKYRPRNLIEGIETNPGLFVLAYLASRVLPIAILHGVLNIPLNGDISSYYIPQGEAVLQGQVPYRDFPSAYGFGFPYLISLLLSIAHARIVIIMFGALVDAFTLALLLYAMKKSGATAIARMTCFIAMSFNPLLFIHTVILGTNQSWVGGLGLAATALATLESDLAAGATLSFAAGLVKALTFFYAPMVFLAVRSERWMLLGAIIVGIVYCTGIYALPSDPFTPITYEFLNSEKFSSGNIWYYANYVIDWSVIPWMARITLIVLLFIESCGVLYLRYAVKKINIREVLSVGMMYWFTFFVFSYNSKSWYLICAMPLVFWWALGSTYWKVAFGLVVIVSAGGAINMSYHSLVLHYELINDLIRNFDTMRVLFIVIDLSMFASALSLLSLSASELYSWYAARGVLDSSPSSSSASGEARTTVS